MSTARSRHLPVGRRHPNHKGRINSPEFHHGSRPGTNWRSGLSQQAMTNVFRGSINLRGTLTQLQILQTFAWSLFDCLHATHCLSLNLWFCKNTIQLKDFTTENLSAAKQAEQSKQSKFKKDRMMYKDSQYADMTKFRSCVRYCTQ